MSYEEHIFPESHEVQHVLSNAIEHVNNMKEVNSVVILIGGKDKEDMHETVVFHKGSHSHAIGMCEYAKHKLLTED